MNITLLEGSAAVVANGSRCMIMAGLVGWITVAGGKKYTLLGIILNANAKNIANSYWKVLCLN